MIKRDFRTKQNMEADWHCQLVALVCTEKQKRRERKQMNMDYTFCSVSWKWVGNKVGDASWSSHHSHRLCLLNILLLLLSHYRKVVFEEKSVSSIKIMSVKPSHFRVIWADNWCRREGWTQNLPNYLLVWGQHYPTCCIAVFQMAKFSVITLTCVFKFLQENVKVDIFTLNYSVVVFSLCSIPFFMFSFSMEKVPCSPEKWQHWSFL